MNRQMPWNTLKAHAQRLQRGPNNPPVHILHQLLRRRLFQPMGLAELEGQLRTVFQAYCDRKLYMATGRQMMNVNG